MSKSTTTGFIAGFAAACIVIGIVVWARTLVHGDERDATRKVVGEAMQQSAHQVADEEVRKAAKDISERLLSGAEKGSAPVPPTVDIAPVETAIQVDREAFSITLPPGSTVDPENKSAGGDHVFSATLAGHCMTSIVVIDKKERAGEYAEDAVASMQKRVENAAEYSPDVLDPFKVTDTKAFWGSVKGEKFVYEFGQVQGRDKASVIVVEYPLEDKRRVVPRLKKALETFQMKE